MPCSYDTFPNIGTTHCYTAAGIFKFSSVPEVNFTGFARGCINCTGFNSPLLPFLVFINTWFVQSLEFVKKSLPSNFLNLDKVCNIEISCGKLFFFAAHHESSWKKLCSCVFFFFKASIDHLFGNLESGKRNHCFGKKVWEKSWVLHPKTCTNPVNRTNS